MTPYDREKIKEGLPKLDALLIDFLLDSGVGPKHIKWMVIMKYAAKIQDCCDERTRAEQRALKEHEDLLKKIGRQNKREKRTKFFRSIRDYISHSIWKNGDF